MIRSLLVANRGEIAVRVIRAAREMGIRTVAIYSDADRHSMHATLADDAVYVGESEPSASYLDIEKVIATARAAGADSVHPGYGFLSERPEFVEACEAAGLTFVGPPSSAMRKLGSKIEAKQIAVRTGVPVTPGYFEPNASVSTLRDEAERIGYPVMLKASAGGGGRGMRIVREPSQFDAELATAQDEAMNAFGDPAMMVERLVERPRHVEVQALADAHGQVAALFERECSVQRRHQKLIEEAPAKDPEGFWPGIRRAAVDLLREAGYVGAATVEFMVDTASDECYFLEVNARLQVEHPVTEAVTGVDIVQWQLRIASGERLELDEALMEGRRERLVGHAIEARVVAEDAARGFIPSIGRVLAWAPPSGPGIRVDTGFQAGSEVSRYYDSLLAKVIGHAPSREQAIERLARALEDFHVIGVKTNIPFLLAVLREPEFCAGGVDTGYIGRRFADWTDAGQPPAELGVIAHHATAKTEAVGSEKRDLQPAWSQADGWRNVESER
jgi:3-methylcrotonyl-CoA carboxylase alpha subunit